MPQKTLTQKQIIKKISNFDWFKDGRFSEAFDFWKNNGETINKLIEKKQFSKSDFDLLTRSINYISIIIHGDNYISELEEKLHFNREEVKPLFIEMCQSYITLAIQFNIPIDEYLKDFDPESSYFHKMKSLSQIRRYDGNKKDLPFLFQEVSTSLGKAIEIDPSSYEACCKVCIELLEIGFKNNWSEDLEIGESKVEIMKFIYKNGDHKFIKALRNSEAFHKWFYDLGHTYDNLNISFSSVQNVIKGIFSENNISGEMESTIIDSLQPKIDKYKIIEKKFNDQKEKSDKLFNDYADKYLDGDKSKFSFKRIEELKHKIYGKDREIVPFDKGEDVFSAISFSVAIGEFYKDKILIGCTYDITEKDAKELQEQLEENFDFKFKVCKLEEEFIDFYGVFDFEHIILEFKSDLSKLAYEIYWDMYDKLDELENYQSDSSSKKIEEKQKVVDSNSKREPDEDKNTIKSMQENVSELDSRLDEYKKSIDRYFSEIVELKKENNALKDLLKEKGITVEDNGEEDLKERRQNYRITVVGGSEFANKGFKNLQKNQAFIDKLEQEYYLNFNQFELKGNYEKQKDKKFAREIGDELLFGSTDFVIILQLDHETALFNLVNNGDQELRSRITCFGEVEEDGKTSKINQKFSYDKFDLYLEKALNKYELRRDNDLIGLN